MKHRRKRTRKAAEVYHITDELIKKIDTEKAAAMYKDNKRIHIDKNFKNFNDFFENFVMIYLADANTLENMEGFFHEYHSDGSIFVGDIVLRN